MQSCDLILRGGQVIDGTGAPPQMSDVAVDRGRIVAVGSCEDWQADTVLDVSGHVIAPGFIDVHTHDDWALLATPQMPFKVTQGVTTVVAGNCGISAAPFRPREDLSAPFDGYLAEVGVRVGDVVEEGEVLLSLDNRSTFLWR